MKKYKVCLDAGHGGKDPGAVNGARQEKDDVLKMTLAVGELLISYGVDICYTRTTDIYEAPSTKAAKGNAAGADLYVSFHRNAAASLDANGTEVWVWNLTGKSTSLAAALCTKYQVIGFTNRGVKDCISNNKSLSVLKNTTMPAVLLELGFISNAKDNRIYDDCFVELVLQTTYGILNYLGVSYNASQTAKKDEWIQEGNRWWYRHADGSYTANNWENINGYWYYFDATGWMKTGWVQWKAKWYYLQSDGAMKTGILILNGKAYALGDDGAMIEGKVTVSINEDGAFASVV